MNEHIRGDERSQRKTTGAAVSWVLAGSAVLAVGWTIVGPLLNRLPTSAGAASSAFGWAAIAYVVTDSLLELLFSLARAESRPRSYAVANAVRVLGTLVVAVVLLLDLGTGPAGAMLAMAAGSTVAGLWLVSRLSPRVSVGHVFAGWRSLLRDGVPLLPANLASWVTDLADRYLLLFITGSAALVGVYSAGYRVGALVTTLYVAPFHTAYLPFMLRHQHGDDSSSELYGEAGRLFLAYGACAALLLQGLAGPLVRGLAGPEYVGAERIVGIVALGCLFAGAAMLMTPAALREHRTHAMAWAFGSGAVLDVVANIILIPRFGMMGLCRNTRVVHGGTHCDVRCHACR